MDNTVLLWEGNSPHNGEHILCLVSGLTDASANRKTGHMLTTWILSANQKPTDAVKSGDDAAICGNCPNRPSTARKTGDCVCYVNHVPLNNIFHAWANGKTKRISERHYERYISGRSVRLGGYGDPAMLPLAVTEKLLSYAKRHTGYTSQWRESYAQCYRELLQASCNNDEQAAIAQEKGWKTYTHYPVSTHLEGKGVVCPNSVDEEITCQVCGLCNGQKTNVVIHDHGLQWKVRK